MKNYYIFILLILVSFLLFGCTTQPKTEAALGATATAKTIVPDLNGYNMDKEILGNQGAAVAGTVSGAVAIYGGVSAPFSVEIGLKTQKFIECANAEGAGSITSYISESNAADFAVLAIGEDDTGKLFKCVVKTAMPFSIAGPTSYGIYGAAYSVKNTDTGTNFYLTFIASNDKAAYALCDKLANCNKDKLFAVAVYKDE